jgi:hypothetical protein
VKKFVAEIQRKKLLQKFGAEKIVAEILREKNWLRKFSEKKIDAKISA